MTTNTFNISGDSVDDVRLYNDYILEHQSEMGVKYVSLDSEIKITYSDRITNFVNGCWRMALNKSPFTSYYANPSTQDNLPTSGWVNIDGDPFLGVFSVDVEPVVIENVETTNTTISSENLSGAVQISVESDDSSTPTTQVFAPVIDDPVGLYTNELTETVVVYGRPTVTFLSHNNITTGSKYAVLVTGYSLQYTTNVYLSSNADLFEQETISTHDDPEYPPISAHETDFDIITENELIVNIPAVYSPGMIDIVISNPAGYGKLTPVYTSTSNNWTEENLQPYIITVDL